MIQSILSFILKRKHLVFLLFICVFSRIISSIFYFEDIDSLRFALSASKFSILESRPHFPGYAVYCFILQTINKFIANIGLSFSIIGGLSIFITILYAIKIHNIYTHFNTLPLAIILFINPIMWLMSNRYMPDILGLALLVAGTYYFIKILKNEQSKDYIIFGAILGLEAGVRLSFMPFFIPAFFLLFNKKIIFSLISFIISIFTWIIPLVYLTGYDEFMQILSNDFYGHFFKWGGTVLSSDSSIVERMYNIIQFTFVDGFAFWKAGRNWSTLINSIVLSFLIFIFIIKLIINRKLITQDIKIILLCYFFYLIWILLFQNINYKPRHIIPFIPLLAFMFSVGINTISKTKKVQILTLLILVVPQIYITLNLINQHQSPSAISQISSILNKEEKTKIVFFADRLKSFYFKKSCQNKNIKFINSDKLTSQLANNYIKNKYTIYTFKKLNKLKYDKFEEIYFFHNPYVNRLWSQLKIYKYE